MQGWTVRVWVGIPLFTISSLLLFVGKELYPGMSGKSLERRLRNTSEAEYIKATEIIHQKLKTEPLYRSEVGELSMAVLKNMVGPSAGRYRI